MKEMVLFDSVHTFISSLSLLFISFLVFITNNFNTFFFFFCFFSISDVRAIYIGYFPTSRTVTVVVVSPHQHRELSPSILEKQFREACRTLSTELPPGVRITFKVNFSF